MGRHQAAPTLTLGHESSRAAFERGSSRSDRRTQEAGQTGPREIERLAEQRQDVQDRLSALESSSAIRGNKETRIRFVAEMLKTRRWRDGHFGRDLFGEPAWDMLLELYLAELEDRNMLVSNVGRGAVAETTALRWLDRLETGGWLSRVPDPVLGRRTYAVLTPKASTAMRAYVDEVLSGRLAWMRQLL